MRTILEEGKEYWSWTIVKFDRVDEKRRRRYICRCKCGYEKSIVASIIASGKCKKCRFCRALRLEGQQFEDWTVLQRLPNDRFGGSMWLCKCKCGNERPVECGNLVNGASKCCFECGHNVTVKTSIIPSSWWYRTMDQAKIRKLKWDISEGYALEILTKQDNKCALSGFPLKFDPRNASIDRIDSSRGYEEGNIQWVHKHINMMKFKYSQTYFVKMCCAIADEFRRKSHFVRFTNKTGVRGVMLDRRTNDYTTGISMYDESGKQLRISLGYFQTLAEAADVKKQAEKLKADGIRDKEEYRKLAPRRKNNTSGTDGVSKCGDKWRAQFQINKKKVHLGLFPTKEEAAEVVRRTKLQRT
jgi:hypothetical protein